MKSRISCVIAALLLSITAFCQNTVTITGHIKNSKTGENVSAVSVTIKGGTSSTFTDENGNFKLVTTQKPPFTIVVSSVGYADKEYQVNSAGDKAEISIDAAYVLGQDIVVAASRVPERILESPVSIERVSNAAIRQSPATSYYDVLANLKGVDVTTSSLTFKTPSTRGFNFSGNARFNQLVDGMDNQAPGLNFSVGGVIGLTELDVDNMELLSGASSALYGSGGMNGTLLINSKDPFKYQGLSLQVKGGAMNINNDGRNNSFYQDYTLRWAQKIGNRFAYKISGQFLEGKDWVAYDNTNFNASTMQRIPGTRESDPNYNGVNFYGDETSANMQSVANAVQAQTRAGILLATGNQLDIVAAMNAALPANPTQQQLAGFIGSLPAPLQGAVTNLVPFYFGLRNGIIPNQNVSRTGYKESDIVDPKTRNIRISGALSYKITDDLTATFEGYYGTGNTVYTGADRFALKNLKMGQYKLELKSKNWFVRGWTTQENSGDAYDATVLTQIMDEGWKASQTWYPQFVGAFVQARSQGADATTAYNAARQYADQGRPLPGTQALKDSLLKYEQIPIPNGGHFLDRSDLYMVEGQYNFSDALKIRDKGWDLLAGASWKQYVLNSQGTLFVDTAGHIKINEIGAYAQVSKKLFNDVLKLTASGRYDKNDNFKGRFTPRVSAVIKVADDQNIRVSYQTAYRFPTTQNQYINLRTGSGLLIGGLPTFRDYYNFSGNPVYTLASFQAFAASAAAGQPNPALLQKQEFGEYKPESSSSFEVGYKALYNKKILLDVYGYYGQYQNFLGRITVIQNPTGTYRPISIAVNSASKVNTYGYGFSLDFLLKNNFFIMGNFYSDDITNVPSNFQAQFNTPKYRTNIGFGNSGFGHGKQFGFNIVYKWQDAFYFNGDFVSGPISAINTLDAQVSFKLPKEKILFKLGATNLLNHYYINGAGNPSIGGMYYASIGYNVF